VRFFKHILPSRQLGPTDEEWKKEMDDYKDELNATIDAFKPLAVSGVTTLISNVSCL
jgi:hypothetical protein